MTRSSSTNWCVCPVRCMRYRRKSKSVGQKKGDLITTAESVINLQIEKTESTALTANDFLFLAGASPGNAVTMISGEMPILSKDAHIIPMAAGLHKHLPQAAAKKSGNTVNYSDSSMPSSKSADAVNYLDNLIDGDKMVRDKVAQAKIARKMQQGSWRQPRSSASPSTQITVSLQNS